MRWLVVALLSLAAFAQKCPVERGLIKDLKDVQAALVSPDAEETTVEELRAFPAPGDLKTEPNWRNQPVEITRYRLRARLVGYKHEADNDYHLVLASLMDPKLTMIGEIPDGRCAGKRIATTVGNEQRWLIATFGKPRGQGKMRKLKHPAKVEIEGIGFFDVLHGQTGVAPNGIEIHPILAIRRVRMKVPDCLNPHSDASCEPTY